MDKKELMTAIENLVKQKLVITEFELMQKFIPSEDLKDLAALKVACYTLEADGKVELMTGIKGELIILNINNVLH